MKENYPAGAANDPRAPYNQPEEDAGMFMVEVSHTFTLKPVIVSDDYDYGAIDERGFQDPNTFTGDAVKEFREQYLPLKEVLGKCKRMINNALDINEKFTTDKKQRERIDKEYSLMLCTINEYLLADEELENL